MAWLLSARVLILGLLMALAIAVAWAAAADYE